jgi:hypothetical protein
MEPQVGKDVLDAAHAVLVCPRSPPVTPSPAATDVVVLLLGCGQPRSSPSISLLYSVKAISLSQSP